MNANHEPNLSTGLPEDSESVLNLEDLFRVIWRRLWLIVLTVIVLVGLSIGYSLTQTPLYEASIKVLIGQERDSVTESLGSEIPGLQQLTLTMAEALSTRPVAEAVIRELNIRVSPEDFLEKNVSVEQVTGTQFIEVSYRDPNPQRAQLVANTIGEVFSRQISEVTASANAITATVWEPAAVPEDPVSPNLVLNALMALAAGGMLGVGLAFLLEYVDESWRSPEEVERVSGVPNFGIIPQYKVLEGKALRNKKGGIKDATFSQESRDPSVGQGG